MPSLVDCKWPLEHLEICIHVTHQFTDIPIPTLGDRERVSGFHLSDTSEKRSFSSSPASLCKPISVCLNVLIILSFNSCFSGMVIKVKLRTLLDSIFLGKNKDKTWKIPWMEESDRLQSMGSLRVGHDWATSLSLFTFMRWRRKWQPAPVFLPGESQGRGSLVGCHLWGCTELDMTEVT